MSGQNESGEQRKIASAVLVLSLCGFAIATVAGGPKSEDLRWDQKWLPKVALFRLLAEPSGYFYAPSNVGWDEGSAWESATREGRVLELKERENHLLRVVNDHGESGFADDAALLLARCRLFYHSDLEGALADMRKVIEEYPDGKWIAEDAVFLKCVAMNPQGADRKNKNGSPYGFFGDVPTEAKLDLELSKIPLPGSYPLEAFNGGCMGGQSGLDENKKIVVTFGREREEAREVWGRKLALLKYCEYLDEHPNWTADEARYWTAWMIYKAAPKERWLEAEKALRELIELRRPENRVQSDIVAAKNMKFGSVVRDGMRRTEWKAQYLLVEMLVREGKMDEAEAAAKDCAQLCGARKGTITWLKTWGLLKDVPVPADDAPVASSAETQPSPSNQ